MQYNRMRRALIALALTPSLGLVFPAHALSADVVENGDFSSLLERSPGSQVYQTNANIGFMPSWTVLSADGAVIETGGITAAHGQSVFRFTALADGFGDNKLDQCVPIDPLQDIAFSYQVRTNVNPATDDLRVRLNPYFYTDMATCEDDLQQDANGQRLSGALSNADRDIRLGSLAGFSSGQWFLVNQATHGVSGPLLHHAEDIPSGARALRVSLRARDDDAATNRYLWLDDIRVSQDGGSTNLISNGDFSHLDLADDDDLSPDQDWYLDRSGGNALRAGAGALPQAFSGANAFYFSSLTGNFGDSKLEQCVPVSGDLRPALAVMSQTPHADLGLRVNLDFYAGAHCDSGEDSTLRLREDFDIDGTPGEWRHLVTTETRDASSLTNVQSALLSIRARDRSDGGDPGSFQRAVYIDGVSVAGSEACNHPGTVGAYEVKAFLDPAVVLDGNQQLLASVKNHFAINDAPYEYQAQYLDTNDQDLRDQGWSIRMRKRDDQGQHRLQYKKRYSVTGGDIDDTLQQAYQDGLNTCSTLGVEVDWGYGNNRTLSFQVNQKQDLPGYDGTDLPDQNETRALAGENMVEELATWNGNWAQTTIGNGRLYGPVYFERYIGDVNGTELRIEVWHVVDESGTGTEQLVEASFKTGNLDTATDERDNLIQTLANEGWLLPQDVLKTQIIMERY